MRAIRIHETLALQALRCDVGRIVRLRSLWKSRRFCAIEAMHMEVLNRLEENLR